MQVMVMETGCGKWVKIGEDVQITYTSNRHEATTFDLIGLHSANGCFEDFYLYQRTMRAVPVGSNALPSECDTVKAFLTKQRAVD